MEFLVPSEAEMADTFSVLVAVGGFGRTFFVKLFVTSAM